MRFAEWHRSSVPIDDEDEEGASFGAELLDTVDVSEIYEAGGLAAVADFIGDVGRDPLGGAWPMNVND